MEIFLPTAIVLMVAVQQFHTMEVITAINVGGGGYRASTDVQYSADWNSYAGKSFNRRPRNHKTLTDPEIYTSSRYSRDPLSYTLPLTGNGCYALYLHFYDETRKSLQFDVVLNHRHEVLKTFEIFTECGKFNVCDKVIYFCVCDNVFHWNRETSNIYNDKLDVSFVAKKRHGFINGILLMKGGVNEAKTIIPNKGVIFFDAAHLSKCAMDAMAAADAVAAVDSLAAVDTTTQLINEQNVNVTIINYDPDDGTF